MIKPIKLKEGEKHTLIYVSDGAMTIRNEVKVSKLLELEFIPSFHRQAASPRGSWQFGTYKQPNKRKEYYLRFKPTGTLVIPEWDCLKTESEAYDSMNINACINLAGTVEQIKALVDTNINPNFEDYDTLIAWPKASIDGEGGELVYPEASTSHAVIEGMRDKLS